MEDFGWMLGAAGIFFGLMALYQVRNLELKLKKFDVIPENFDPSKEPQEGDGE